MAYGVLQRQELALWICIRLDSESVQHSWDRKLAFRCIYVFQAYPTQVQQCIYD